jgi:hypothetical protein
MKNKLFSIITFLLFSQYSLAQEKIKADLKIINFLGKSPYKSEKNSQSENLLRILYFNPQPENNSKIGFLDTKGKIIIKPIYNMASDFYNGHANIIKDSTYGYIDRKGTEVLFKQYEETYFYYGNTGIAKKDGKFGLIDRDGNPLTDFRYNMIFFFGFNHFKGIISKNSNHLLDNRGKIVFNENLEYDIKSDYFEKDSLLVYEKIIDNKKLQGLVGIDNNIIIEPKYDNIYFIEDPDFFVVKKDNKYGFVNKSGIEIIPVIYDQVGFNITEDLISVKQKNKWGFVNRNNEIIIAFEYDEAYPFFDGIAFVKKENIYEGIDKNNTVKAKFSTEKSEFPFYSNNLSLFKKDGKYGYINKKGNVVIPAIYLYAYPFVNEMAYVELNGKSGFINKKGKEIIPITYNQLWLESEKLIRFVE